jgi:hypothetical protein
MTHGIDAQQVMPLPLEEMIKRGRPIERPLLGPPTLLVLEHPQDFGFFNMRLVPPVSRSLLAPWQNAVKWLPTCAILSSWLGSYIQ